VPARQAGSLGLVGRTLSRQQVAGTCLDQRIDFDTWLEVEGFNRLGGYTDFQIHTAGHQQIYGGTFPQSVLDRALEEVSRARLSDSLSRDNDVIRSNPDRHRRVLRQRVIRHYELAAGEVDHRGSFAFVMILNPAR